MFIIKNSNILSKKEVEAIKKSNKKIEESGVNYCKVLAGYFKNQAVFELQKI